MSSDNYIFYFIYSEEAGERWREPNLNTAIQLPEEVVDTTSTKPLETTARPSKVFEETGKLNIYSQLRTYLFLIINNNKVRSISLHRGFDKKYMEYKTIFFYKISTNITG